MVLIRNYEFIVGAKIETNSGEKGIITDTNCLGKFSIMVLTNSGNVLFFDKNGISSMNDKTKNLNTTIEIADTVDLEILENTISDFFEKDDFLYLKEKKNYPEDDENSWIIRLSSVSFGYIDSDMGYCFETEYVYKDKDSSTWGSIRDIELIRKATKKEIDILYEVTNI